MPEKVSTKPVKVSKKKTVKVPSIIYDRNNCEIKHGDMVELVHHGVFHTMKYDESCRMFMGNIWCIGIGYFRKTNDVYHVENKNYSRFIFDGKDRYYRNDISIQELIHANDKLKKDKEQLFKEFNDGCIGLVEQRMKANNTKTVKVFFDNRDAEQYTRSFIKFVSIPFYGSAFKDYTSYSYDSMITVKDGYPDFTDKTNIPERYGNIFYGNIMEREKISSEIRKNNTILDILFKKQLNEKYTEKYLHDNVSEMFDKLVKFSAGSYEFIYKLEIGRGYVEWKQIAFDQKIEEIKVFCKNGGKKCKLLVTVNNGDETAKKDSIVTICHYEVDKNIYLIMDKNRDFFEVRPEQIEIL